jgi:hypothetical protein
LLLVSFLAMVFPFSVFGSGGIRRLRMDPPGRVQSLYEYINKCISGAQRRRVKTGG